MHLGTFGHMVLPSEALSILRQEMYHPREQKLPLHTILDKSQYWSLKTKDSKNPNALSPHISYIPVPNLHSFCRFENIFFQLIFRLDSSQIGSFGFWRKTCS